MIEWKKVNWTSGIFLITYQLLLFISLPLYLVYFAPSIWMVLASILLAGLCVLGVTTSYHRLYSHRSYKTNRAVEAVMVFFGTLAFQGSVLEWSYEHRLHHRYVDTDKDPYNIKRGFWYAHFLWMMEKREGIKEEVVSDLMQNKFVMFQHKQYLPLVIGTNLAVILLAAFVFKDLLGAFIFIFLLRLFLSHHLTWFINSLAHTWGSKPYSKEHSAVNNWIIALLTNGEGYHNFHHTFASDYRNGVRWYQWDPTKALIWTLSKLGLARKLIRVNSLTIKRRLLMEDRRMLLERLRNIRYVKWDFFEKKINTYYEQIYKKIADANVLLAQYRDLRKQKAKKHRLESMKQQISKLRKSIRKDLRAWGKLCDDVLSLKPTL